MTATDNMSEAELERLHQLGLELRCLVCQNQSIADSNSGLAVDLRKQIAQKIQSGESDTAIKQYMVERYGDFVLYKPPYSMNNAALWIGPFLILAIGMLIALRAIRKRKRSLQTAATPLTSESELRSESRQEPAAERLQEIEARYQSDSR